MIMIPVRYVNIDDWNRPVFRSINGAYYGCLDKLFPYETGEEEVLELVNASDLVWFGNSFNCEPAGDPPPVPIEILRGGLLNG